MVFVMTFWLLWWCLETHGAPAQAVREMTVIRKRGSRSLATATEAQKIRVADRFTEARLQAGAPRAMTQIGAARVLDLGVH